MAIPWGAKQVEVLAEDNGRNQVKEQVIAYSLLLVESLLTYKKGEKEKGASCSFLHQ